MSKPYTQPGEKGTDTNQASEDELEALYKDEVNYALHLLSLPVEDRPIHVMLRAKQRLDAIRTEKLKLLDEVRERVVGRNQPLPKRGDVSPDIHVEVTHRVEGRNALRAEQLANLTKLEAEL